jgi:hypothetical protein
MLAYLRGGDTLSFTPEAFSTGTVEQRLQWCREAIGRVLYSQESDLGGSRNKRAELDYLRAYHNDLMLELAYTNGTFGYNVAAYSRGGNQSRGIG